MKTPRKIILEYHNDARVVSQETYTKICDLIEADKAEKEEVFYKVGDRFEFQSGRLHFTYKLVGTMTGGIDTEGKRSAVLVNELTWCTLHPPVIIDSIERISQKDFGKMHNKKHGAFTLIADKK